jgi:hypothetical protein
VLHVLTGREAGLLYFLFPGIRAGWTRIPCSAAAVGSLLPGCQLRIVARSCGQDLNAGGMPGGVYSAGGRGSQR